MFHPSYLAPGELTGKTAGQEGEQKVQPPPRKWQKGFLQRVFVRVKGDK